MKKFSIITTLIVLCFCSISAKEKFIYSIFSQEEGLTSTINSIYKEKDGLIWLGTPTGLYTFNGHDIKPFISGMAIYEITEDRNGGLWVLTDNWVMYRERGADEFQTMTAETDFETAPFYSSCQDEEGLWFGSQGSIYRYTYKDNSFRRFSNMEGLENYFCLFMNKVGESSILCSSNLGAYLVDTETGELTETMLGPIKQISGTMTDSKGRLWVAFYNHGIRVYDKEGNLLKSYSTQNSGLSNDLVICFTEKGSKIWAGTDGGGINIIDPETDEVTVLSHISGDSSSFPAHSIKRLYTDSYGNIWAGSTREGLIGISRTGMTTFSDSHIGLTSGLSNRTVLCLFQEEGERYVWIGTDGEGLNRLDPHTTRFTHYDQTLKTKIVSVVTYSDTELALSIYADGAYLFDKNTGKIRPLPLEDEELKYFMRYTGRSVVFINGKDDSIYFLRNCVQKYDKKTGSCHLVPLQEGAECRGNMYLVGHSEKGIYLHDSYNLYLLDEEAGEVKEIFRSEDFHVIRSGCLGAGGDIWLATDNGLGRFNENSRELSFISTSLFSDATAVVWDGKSKVWIGSGPYLYAYLTDEDSFTMFGESDGAAPNEYLAKPRLLSEEGNVYIGGVHGLLSIDSEYTIDASEVPAISLYDLSADRKRINPDENGIYEVPRHSKLLNISVSTHETDIFRQKMYRFSFSGSGKDYELMSPALEIQDLPKPGKYDVMVSCTKRNGDWTEPTKILTIRIPHPWYLSGWFIAGTLVFLLITGASIIIGLMSRKANRLKLELKEKEQMVYEEKVRMLINISHELRTPLTLIMAPLKRLLNFGSTSPQEHTATLQRIYRQSKRMKGLLDMVLDLRKMEVSKSGLKLERAAFNEWISYTVEDIISEEDAEDIHISLELDTSVGLVDFDRTKCETVLMNLLMNAIKHSEKGGHITIRTSVEDNGFVRVSVSDEGPGLGDIDRSKMFTRFYQSNSEKYGSGIGLSYSKLLVELHGGRIGAENNPDKGATFWWEIPTVSDNAVEVPSKAYLNELIGSNTADDVSLEETEGFSTKGLKIMLVDDSQDLLEFLSEALSGEFAEIITATGGNSAFRMISSGIMPDIIVSDVNMPEGDGYRLCKEIKGSEKYSHIPVVLLTARGEEQSQGESYRLGADGFLSKPFEVETLFELVRNLLKRKHEIRKKYLDTEGEATADYGSNEETFILQLNRIISENLGNPALDQQLLCLEMGMSRASLYNKMKAITGAGAKEYITRIRLEKAKSLMESTNLSIVEISERTGFASQSYFSTAFKAYTGMTPSQYKKQKASE